MLQFKRRPIVLTEEEMYGLLREHMKEETAQQVVETALAEQEMTLSEVSEEFDIPLNTLHTWIARGYLAVLRKEPGTSGKNGGKVIVVRKNVQTAIASVKPIGRPRKMRDSA